MGGRGQWSVPNLPVMPVEEFLEFLRVGRDASPHTLRSYAASLNAWWDYLEAAGLAWNEVTLPSFLPFLTVLRTGDPVGVHRLPGAGAARGGVAESTVGLRVAAVLSFYRYHADVHGTAVAGRLYRAGGRRARSRYVRALAHLDHGSDQASPAVRVRTRDRGPAPVLTPTQAEAILDGCARFDAVSGQWTGSVRDRLLFATLSETGMRLGECLSLKHCDWHVGRGGTPFVEVVPRQDHPAGVRVKNSRFRRIYISERPGASAQPSTCGNCAMPTRHRAVGLENWCRPAIAGSHAHRRARLITSVVQVSQSPDIAAAGPAPTGPVEPSGDRSPVHICVIAVERQHRRHSQPHRRLRHPTPGSTGTRQAVHSDRITGPQHRQERQERRQRHLVPRQPGRLQVVPPRVE